MVVVAVVVVVVLGVVVMLMMVVMVVDDDVVVLLLPVRRFIIFLALTRSYMPDYPLPRESGSGRAPARRSPPASGHAVTGAIAIGRRSETAATTGIPSKTGT